MARPLFDDPGQALSVTTVLAMQLVVVMAWVWFVLLHLAAIALALLGLWWFHVTPEQAASAVQSLSRSWLAATANALGVSVTALGYLAVARWIWARTFVAVLGRYLLRHVPRSD